MIDYNDFIHSDTADKKGIDNTPDETNQTRANLFLELAIKPLEDLLGDVVIHSGYRCEALNTLLKGSKTSDHMKANAIDFHVHGETVEDTLRKIKNSDLRWKQLIFEHRKDNPNNKWIHFSYDTDVEPEKQKMISIELEQA